MRYSSRDGSRFGDDWGEKSMNIGHSGEMHYRFLGYCNYENPVADAGTFMHDPDLVPCGEPAIAEVWFGDEEEKRGYMKVCEKHLYLMIGMQGERLRHR